MPPRAQVEVTESLSTGGVGVQARAVFDEPSQQESAGLGLECPIRDYPAIKVKKEEAISLLLTGASVTEVAEEVGVHRATVHRWLADPIFRKELSIRKDELLERTFEFQIFASMLATKKLVELLSSEDERVTLWAARALVSLKEAYLALDHERRIRQMEDNDESLYGRQ